jgi:hypothetical protein
MRQMVKQTDQKTGLRSGISPYTTVQASSLWLKADG